MFFSRSISFHIISLGCPKNLVESERLNGKLHSAGFRFAGSPDDADIIIVNTCGFITDAKKESIGVILDAAEIRNSLNKTDSPKVFTGSITGRDIFKKKIAAVGCLTERYFNEISGDIPELDFVYGIIDDRLVPSLCAAFDIKYRENKSAARKPLTPGLPYSYIKISDGCSNRCSYCAIPAIRGPHRPYSPALILDDASAACRKGSKELIVIAQDITSYKYGSLRLAGLAGRLSRIRGAEWIRLMYCHPDHITSSIIELLRTNNKVVKYIDIPFQHASRRILKSMGRKGDCASHLGLIRKLRESVPDIHIRSTIMTGYPGESDDEFRELISFVKEANIERLGCFTYSKEENTPAADLADNVPLE